MPNAFPVTPPIAFSTQGEDRYEEYKNK